MAVALVSLAGCLPESRCRLGEADQTLLDVVLPARIEIVEPFTRVRSFDEDDAPDGIEVLLRAVNALDNPGLMMVGHVRIELFEFVPASAEHKGRRLGSWQVDLSSKVQQRAYWNRLTQMYQFQLELAPELLPVEQKAVLLVTYRSPMDRMLTDEHVLSPRGTPPLGAGVPFAPPGG